MDAIAWALYHRLHVEFGGWVIPVCLSIAVVLVIFVPGTSINLRAVALLRDGVRRDLFAAEQVDRVRGLVEHQVWTLLVWGMFSVFLLGAAFTPRHSILSSGYLFLWLPFHLFNSLRTSVRKPDEGAPNLMGQLGSKPLRSEYWGAGKSIASS